MGRRPKGFEKKVEIVESDVKDIATQESIDDKLAKRDEILQRESEINRLNSEKSNKDILLKTIDELKVYEKEIRAEIARLGVEADSKTKITQHLDNEIQSLNYRLSVTGGDFDKINAERLKNLAQKEAVIAKAEIEYQQVLADNNSKSKLLKAELQKIADERATHKTEQATLKEWVETNRKNLSAMEKDIENREEELRLAREEFEVERDALKPELDKISAIKNENNVLWQKMEHEKSGFEANRLSMESYKATIEAEKDSLRARLDKEREQLKAQEAKLRQWEQDLNDQSLEVKAKEAEAIRAMKRYQLTSSIEAK